jgi:hypothetical protein
VGRNDSAGGNFRRKMACMQVRTSAGAGGGATSLSSSGETEELRVAVQQSDTGLTSVALPLELFFMVAEYCARAQCPQAFNGVHTVTGEFKLSRAQQNVVKNEFTCICKS